MDFKGKQKCNMWDWVILLGDIIVFIFQLSLEMCSMYASSKNNK